MQFRIRFFLSVGLTALGLSSFVAACGSSADTSTGSTAQSTSSGSTTAAETTTGTGTGGMGGAGTIAVAGKVTDVVERAVPSETVMIGDKIVVTDSEGAFSFDSVTVPYTLRVIDSTAGVTDFWNLSSTHPIAQIAKYPPSMNQASVAGSVSGTSIPLKGMAKSFVQYSSTYDSDFELAQAGGGDSGTTYSLLPRFAESAEPGHVMGISWIGGPNNLPTSYLQFGSFDLTVASGGAFNQTLQLSPIGSGSVHVQTSLSGAQALETIWPFLDAGSGSLFLPEPTQASTALDLVTPTVAGGSFGVAVFTSEGNPVNETISFRQGKPLSGNVDVVVPKTSTLSAPSDGAHIAVVGTEFSWQTPTNQLNIVQIGNYTAVTMADSMVVPDLSSVGVTFKPGVQFYWSLVGFGPFTSIDAAAESATLYRNRLRVVNSYPLGPVSDGFIAISATRSLMAQ